MPKDTPLVHVLNHHEVVDLLEMKKAQGRRLGRFRREV